MIRETGNTLEGNFLCCNCLGDRGDTPRVYEFDDDPPQGDEQYFCVHCVDEIRERIARGEGMPRIRIAPSPLDTPPNVTIQ